MSVSYHGYYYALAASRREDRMNKKTLGESRRHAANDDTVCEKSEVPI